MQQNPLYAFLYDFYTFFTLHAVLITTFLFAQAYHVISIILNEI